jgi:hypothetical protein
VGRPRAGLVAGIVLLSMPLLVMQSRMLTSDIGTACGAALIIYGFLALQSAHRLLGGGARRFTARTIDMLVGAAALALGILIGFFSGGALLGLLVPIGAIAAAGKLGVPFVVDAGKWIYNGVLRLFRRSKWTIGRAPLRYSGEHYGPMFFATLATIALVGLLAYQIYDLKDPHPGIVPPARQVAGIVVQPEGCWSWLLGGVWRPEDDLRFVFDSSFEEIAYGTFPWGILGPVAMLLLLRDDGPKARFAGALTLAWAGGAWIATEAFQRKVGVAIWAGFPAVAVAIGVWFDAVLERKARDRRVASRRGDRMTPVHAGVLLLALFLLLAVLDFGKDLQSFPDKITSLLSGQETVTYPVDSKLLLFKTKLWILILGQGIAVCVAIALMMWHRIATYAAAAALGGSIVMGAFWSFAWHPRLATHLSSKAMFETYEALAKPGEPLHIMGELGHAPLAYTDVKPEKAVSREQVVTALKQPKRVFAIAPQSELCSLHREMGEKPYFVVDDRNTRNLLFSNSAAGTTDKNPLRNMIVHHEPKGITSRPKGKVVWDNRIELLGWDLPKTVQRGAAFEVTVYYKILQPVTQNWTALMHIDGAIRIGGDHPPIEDRCKTSTWQAGDFIIDRTTVVAGGAGHPLGTYVVWIGFFTGTAPNFKNMTVSAAPPDLKDTADRVKLTSLILD